MGHFLLTSGHELNSTGLTWIVFMTPLARTAIFPATVFTPCLNCAMSGTLGKTDLSKSDSVPETRNRKSFFHAFTRNTFMTKVWLRSRQYSCYCFWTVEKGVHKVSLLFKTSVARHNKPCPLYVCMLLIRIKWEDYN